MAMTKRRTAPPVSTTWELVEEVIPLSERVLLYGPPGTGKTTAAVRVGTADVESVINLTVTDEMPAAELRGHWIPEGQEFRWHHGPAIRAWLEGRRLVINEIDRASADTLSFLRALLDDAGVAALHLPSGQRVTPARGFRVVATMNGDPSIDLPGPLRDRFPVTIHVDEVHPAALARLPDDLRRLAAATTLLPEAERRVSVRVWLEFAFLRERLGAESAARACFGPRSGQLLNDLRVAP